MARTRPRPPSEKKLDKAMRVFWEKGYYDTSIETLMKRAGLNRAAIYGAYGSKRGFFEVLLGRYRATITAHYFAPLEEPDAAFAQLETFVQGFRSLREPESQLGCLLCLTASEVSPHVRSVEGIVSSFVKDLRSLIRAACVNARDRGEVRPETDPDLVADYLAGAVLGVWAVVRSPMPRTAIASYVHGILTYLQGLRPVGRAGGL